MSTPMSVILPSQVSYRYNKVLDTINSALVEVQDEEYISKLQEKFKDTITVHEWYRASIIDGTTALKYFHQIQGTALSYWEEYREFNKKESGIEILCLSNQKREIIYKFKVDGELLYASYDEDTARNYFEFLRMLGLNPTWKKKFE
jgi:ribosomal protein S8